MQYLKYMAEFLKKKRLETNKTLNSFAIFAGLEPATLSRYENSQRKISLESFVKIAVGLGITPAELFQEYDNFLKNNVHLK